MIKLHLGCGEIKLKYFINIDMVKTVATDRVLDVRRLDYADNSIGEIYAAHVLEHFNRKEVLPVLKEWHRTLRQDGFMVIVVPNFDLCVDWYSLRFPLRHIKYVFFKYILGFKKIDSGRELTENFICDVMGGGDTNYDYQVFHRVLFNPRSFKQLAREAGFKRVEQINLEEKFFPISGIDHKKLHCFSMAFSLYKK
jgi:ubiquinone/menaquinone biosynthesis C-methylase UbiE